MILLVSHEDDDHLAPVRAHLARTGREHLVLDTAAVPTQVAVTAEHGERDGWRMRLADGRRVDLAEVGSGWWRRPLPARVDDRITDPHDAAFAAHETFEALAGIVDALDVAWVSPPAAITRSMMKTWQLPAAHAVGLGIPRTLVTSDPQEARAFVASVGVGQVICKAFSASEQRWRETRMVGPAEVAMLDRVALAPVIFQEFVPAVLDLRVIVVGGEVFAATVNSQELPYPLDFRLHLESARIAPTRLPDDVVAALHRLMERAGLRYGAIDMRLTPAGEHVFLEVNPAGQWLFVEEATGQPITAAVCSLLADLDRR